MAQLPAFMHELQDTKFVYISSDIVLTDKRGHYFVGPDQRLSYFDFYVSRAQACGIPTDSIRATEISDTDLAALRQCADRLWSET